jgi:hypothetical protein
MDGISVKVIGRDLLLRNKRAVGRPQDIADVARLSAQRPTYPKKKGSEATSRFIKR